MTKDEIMKLADAYATEKLMSAWVPDRNKLHHARAEAKARAALEAALASPCDALTERGVHLSHCNQDDYIGCCKYGDEDCPALTEKQEPHCESTNQADRRPDMFCKVQMCSVLGECSKVCRHHAPVNQRIAELEAENERLSSHMADLRNLHAKRIDKLEAALRKSRADHIEAEREVDRLDAALDVALEALSWIKTGMGCNDIDAVIAKLKEVRK